MAQPRLLLQFDWNGPHCFAYLTWEELLCLGTSCNWLWRLLWGPGGRLPHLPLLALAATTKPVLDTYHCAHSNHRQVMPSGRLNLAANEQFYDPAPSWVPFDLARGLEPIKPDPNVLSWIIPGVAGYPTKQTICSDCITEEMKGGNRKHENFCVDRVMLSSVPVTQWGKPGATAALRSFRWRCRWGWKNNVEGHICKPQIISSLNQFTTACQLATAAGSPAELVVAIQAIWSELHNLSFPPPGQHFCTALKPIIEMPERCRAQIRLAAEALAARYLTILNKKSLVRC